jgi:hypothetical protein
MWNWLGQRFEGLIEGNISTIKDSADSLAFRVETDGVIRTVWLKKSDARIRVSAEGITITEVNRNA